MAGLKKKRRIQMLAVAGACLAGVLVILWYLPDDSFQYFMSPSEIVENPPPSNQLVRVGGLVVDGSIRADEGVRFFFEITDGGSTVSVHYIGNDLKPDLFKEGQGTIATGKLVNDTFQATEILAKHDENYMPKEVADALKEQGVFQPADGE